MYTIRKLSTAIQKVKFVPWCDLNTNEALMFSSYYNNFTFDQIDKLIYFTFDIMKQEWKIKNTERH